MAAHRVLPHLLGALVFMALALVSESCSQQCSNACRGISVPFNPQSCFGGSSIARTVPTNPRCGSRCGTRTQCECRCTNTRPNGCSRGNTIILKRTGLQDDIPDVNHQAVKRSSSTEDTPEVYQAEVDPIDELWIQSNVHPDFSLVEGSPLTCDVSSCDSSCGFMNFADLTPCGHPNITVVWDLRDENEFTFIRPVGTKPVGLALSDTEEAREIHWSTHKERLTCLIAVSHSWNDAGFPTVADRARKGQWDNSNNLSQVGPARCKR